MTAIIDQKAAGSRLVRIGVFVAIGAAITAWIFSRSGTPFAGYDWVELEGFNKQFYRDALHAGHLPLWNPYVGFGRPFLADIDTATLYPPNIIFLLSDGWALPLCVWLHTILILAGACELCRDLNLGWRASLLAGVTFALSATLTARLQAGQIQVFCTFAYLPLWWTFAWRAWRRPSWNAMVAFAVITTMVVLAGSPPLLWAMSWVVLTWLVAWAAGQPWRESLRGATTVFAGGVAGLGLAGLQLLPFLELAREGNRPLHDPSFANMGGLPLRNLASLFVPSTDVLKFFWEMNLFTGVLAPLGLVALGFARQDRAARAFVAVAICSLLLAVAPLGLAGSLAAWLPGMGAFRLPCRFAIVVGWSLVMVALLVWRQRAGPKGKRIALFASVVQIGSLLWAVDLHANHYAVAAPPGPERQVAARAGNFTVEPTPLRIALARDAVRANSGVLYGFSNLESFASPGLARVWNAAHALAGIPPRVGDPVRTADLAVQSREALEKWGVQFGWDVQRGEFFSAPGAAPRAQAVFAVETVLGAPAGARRWWTEPPGTAFIETKGSQLSTANRRPQALTITGYAADHVNITWRIPEAGRIVLAEPWYPGWSAYVAGEWTDVLPVNGWMRTVAVPAGQETVRFEFRPHSVAWGALMSVSTAAAMFVGSWWFNRKKSFTACKMPPCSRVGFSP